MPERIARRLLVHSMTVLMVGIAGSMAGALEQPLSAGADGSQAVGAEGSPAVDSLPLNPHSDLIFRATDAKACGDCHLVDRDGALRPHVADNDLVRRLRARAKGVHGPGRFADCLRCHAGGRVGVERYLSEPRPQP